MTKPPADDSSFERASLMLENESTWFYASIVSVFCVIILIISGVTYAWVEVSDANVFASRIDSIYKLALLGGALATFCTVAWRGLVGIRQAKAQVEATLNQTKQLILSREQMEATERNELAKLFQKGVELINGEKLSERSAGISTLEVVALTKKNFAMQSLDQIADGYQAAGNDDYHSDESGYFRAAITLINAETGFVANRKLEFTIDDQKVWKPTPGIRSVENHGGVLRGRRRESMDRRFDNAYFTKTKVVNLAVDVDYPKFDDCNFRSCKIMSYDTTVAFAHFSICDFSSCEIINFDETLELGSKNYYYAGTPPFADGGASISEEWIKANLTVREPVKPDVGEA